MVRNHQIDAELGLLVASNLPEILHPLEARHSEESGAILVKNKSRMGHSWSFGVYCLLLLSSVFSRQELRT